LLLQLPQEGVRIAAETTAIDTPTPTRLQLLTQLRPLSGICLG
jgi:hypothetical protein